MIELLRSKISKDKECQDQFDYIVNNSKNSFSQKVDALRELTVNIKKKEENDYATQLVLSKVNEIKRMTQEFEQNNEDLAVGIEQFIQESQLESLPADRKATHKLFNILEKVKEESDAKAFTQDELDQYTVSLSFHQPYLLE